EMRTTFQTPLRARAWSPGANRLVLEAGKEVELVDGAGQRVASLPLHSPLRRATFTKDGARLAVISEDEGFVVDASGARLATLEGFPLTSPGTLTYPDIVSWSPTGDRLAYGAPTEKSGWSEVHAWDVAGHRTFRFQAFLLARLAWT